MSVAAFDDVLTLYFLFLPSIKTYFKRNMRVHTAQLSLDCLTGTGLR